jgi:hypothetical protein
MIRTEQDDVELLLIHPIYRTRISHRTLDDGTKARIEKRVIIRELRVIRWFKRDAIVGVQQYITAKNTVAKNRCLVLDKYSSQFYAVFHSVDDVRLAIKSKPKSIIGFNHVSKVQT